LPVPLGKRLTIPIWLEGRVGAERALLLRDPVSKGQGCARWSATRANADVFRAIGEALSPSGEALRAVS
jgi:hypothetical protein